MQSPSIMSLYIEVILVIYVSIGGGSGMNIAKYSSLPPGMITKPAGDVIKSLQVKVEEDCLIWCHESEKCTSYEVSYNGQYSCTLRKVFSEDPVQHVDNPGLTSYFLGKILY